MIKRMERHEKLLPQRKNVSNSFKKLREIQIYVASLEWFKKDAKHKKIGYYDMYKMRRSMDVYYYKKKLMSYWQDSVAEEEYKPHEEGDFFWTSWLMAGTSYRRMIEPLHIAEYYMVDDAENYITERPRHFTLLEQWWNEREKPEASPNKAWIKRQVAASRLNEDSCFWARVEEALISCKQLNNKDSNKDDKESLKQKLKVFEGYVYDAIKNNAVSLDIFLEGSSFRQWWNKYEEIMGSSYCSSLMMKFWEGMGAC